MFSRPFSSTFSADGNHTESGCPSRALPERLPTCSADEPFPQAAAAPFLAGPQPRSEGVGGGAPPPTPHTSNASPTSSRFGALGSWLGNYRRRNAAAEANHIHLTAHHAEAGGEAPPGGGGGGTEPRR